MAQNILEKEQSNTKETLEKELNTAINSPDTIPQNTNTSQSESQSNIIDNKSSMSSTSANDSQIVEETTSSSILRKFLPLICISIVILLFIFIFSTAFAFANMNNSKIIKGVCVNGIDISELTSAEASKKLLDEFSKKLDATLTLSYGDFTSELIPVQDIDASYNVSAALEEAYNIGRSGNIFQNNYAILTSLIANKNVNVNLQYNAEKLDSYINDISVKIPGLVEQPSYYTENDSLIILRGHAGIELLKDETKNLLLSNINSLSSTNSIELPTQNVEPDKINFNKIHTEIYAEPQNAYVIKEPFELNVGSSGIDFAITFEEAEKLIEEKKDEYIIPLKITPPEIGIEDLGNDIFVHNLGKYVSYYKVSNVNRTTNVNLASKKINNVILLPGEVFSYNKVVGERTFANGFKEASVYTSSGVVNGLGGGICQVSSTLYNAALLANLEIVERRNHRYAVSYVPLGRDATVAYGSIDFRFKNNRNYPIKIISSAQNGVLTINIMGIKEETEYEVSITTKRLQTIPYKTKYIEDSSLTVGTQKQTQYGDNGYKYETYKTLLLNGNVVSSNLISTDNYTPLTRVVRVGTKQQQVVTPPAPTNNTNPSTPSPTENSISNTPAQETTTNNNETSSSSTTNP